MKFSYEGEKSQWKIGSLILFGLLMVMLAGPGSVAETLAQTANPEGWYRLRTNSVPYQPRHVALDAQGGLWVSAIDGTEYEPGLWYRPAGGSFHYWTPDRRNNAVSAAYNPPVVKPELNTTVLYAVRDKEGNTWYALKNRKVLCEKTDGTWLTYNMPDSSDVQPGTNTINVDSAHRIRLIDKQDGTQEKLLIAYRGVVRVDAGFTVVETRKVYYPENNYFIRDVLIDSQGRYWVTSEMGLEKGTSLNATTYVKALYPSGEYPSAPGASTILTRMVEDASGNIWFGSESGYGADGIYRFTSTGEWVKYATGVVNDIGKTVHDIAPASDGSVWFGAYYSGAGGLLRYVPTEGGGQWTRYRGADLGLDSEEVPSLVSDGQGLWFATAYTPTVTGNGTGVHYLTLNDQGQPNVTHYTYRGSSTTLTSLRFNYIAADRSGGVWFPAYDDPSIARLKADGTWQQFRQAGNGSWGSGGFAGVAADSQNRVYFAPTNSPPVAYDVAAERWLDLPASPFGGMYYYGVYVDPQDGKWFFGAYGVYYLNPENTAWTSFNPAEVPQFPANYFVNDVLVDDAGNAWFMCRSEIVLMKKDPNGGAPAWFKFIAGDASGFTGGYRVYQDDSGQVWNAAKQKFNAVNNTWQTVADTSAFDHRQLRFLNGRVQADWDLSGALPPITGLDERNMTVDSRGTIYFTGWLGNVNAGIVAFGMQSGDMDRNGRVDLADALLVAKVLIGQPSAVFSGSSIDGDGKIGLAEMLFVLQSLAGLRTGQTGGTLRGTLALPSGIEGLASNNVLVQLEGTSFSATPGNDGSFTISNIPAGNYSLLVESGENQAYKYRATFTITNGKTINTGNIDLLKTGTISGSATLENVFDHAGVDVYLAGTSFLARTAGDGSYRIYYVPPGFYTLIAAYSGYQRVVIEGIEVKAGEDTLVKPMLLKKETLTVGAVYGRVYTDDAGGVRRPLAGANVHLFMPWTMGTSLRPGPNFATSTDDNGYFLLQDIPAGLYVIQVIANGYRPEKREIAVKGGENLSLEFSLAAAVTGTGDISGYVVEDTGMLTLWKPLGGARVSLLTPSGTIAFTLTEGDGSFKFSGIAGGAYELQAGKEGYRPERVPVTVVPGQTGNITIRLAPVLPPGELGNISGFVKDTAGNGLPGAKVLATRAMMGISIEKPYIYETVTGEDGSFSIELMPPGIYKLIFAKEGFQMASLPVEVKSGETSSVQAVLKPIVTTTGSIAGTVADNAGNPVPEVAITVEIPISCAQLSIIGCGHPVFLTLSDENGNFELANLPALEGYVLTAQKTGYEKVVKTSVNVTAGGVTRADITLHALDSGVELILTDTDGKPLPGMMARVSGPDIELYRLTDQSGKVVFYLKPGEYLLTAPIENYYRIMGDVVMGDGSTIAGSSLGMPICYPDYAGCFNFGQTFIPHSEKVNVNQGEFVKTIFRIERFLLEPAEGAVTNDPLPTFSWNPYPKAASYTIRVHDNVAMQIMWQATLAETTAVYNYDGTGRPLLPGARYSWQITTDTGVQSNRRSFTTTAADTAGTIVP